MSLPSIAVVIPLYNHSAYITEALQSVAAQTYPAKEVWVIDDGSPDDSHAKAQACQEFLPQLHCETRENRGAHATLNEAIKKAVDCDLVAILNSDDVYLPHRLEHAAKAFSEDPEQQMWCSPLRVINQDSQVLAPEHPRSRWFDTAWSLPHEVPSPVESLAIANFPATTSNIIARSAWLAQYPFRGYRYAHDYFALLWAAFHEALGFGSEVSLSYRVHDSNTITTEPRRLIEEMLRFNLDLTRAVHDPAVPEQVRKNHTRYFQAAADNFSAFRQDLFLGMAARALAEYPNGEKLLAQALAQPEAGVFPNKNLANTHDKNCALFGAGSGIAERLTRLQEENRNLRHELKQLRAQEKEWQRKNQSRSQALRRLLGLK